MHFDALADGLGQADVVIVASGAPHIVLHAADIERAMALRTQRPLVVIDLAVPRNVDPAIRDIAGTHVYDMDDLNAVVASQTSGSGKCCRRRGTNCRRRDPAFSCVPF